MNIFGGGKFDEPADELRSVTLENFDESATDEMLVREDDFLRLSSEGIYKQVNV